MKMNTIVGCVLAISFLTGCHTVATVSSGTPSDVNFAHPPNAARPWVYWFWLSGNVTREGITADLEAMKRVGIGGVILVEVEQGTPAGPVAFASPEWRKLFTFVCAEADRLSLQVNMINDAGWCGSGGPWITPELSMQKVVWTQANVEGGRHIDQPLAQPEKAADYYQDIGVLAYPTPEGKYVIDDIKEKSLLQFNPYFPFNARSAAPNSYAAIPSNQTVSAEKVVDLTASFRNGRLNWDAPQGKWTILRLGHTITGSFNGPAPASGLGLECDKLSPQAADVMFAGLMGKLVADNQPLVGKTLVSAHIDSWEVGTQNWTPLMLAEFQQRRGYDAKPFLPTIAGRVVDTLEKSERFLWDWRQTIAELLAENYAGRFETLAKQNGIKLSVEAYGWGPFDDIRYAGRADEPMGEFWSWGYGVQADSVTEMTSAAHAYGKPIVGAEAFTATDAEAWRGHPGNYLKSVGDWAFCEGINRFVIHRYAMQPWHGDYKPGMSMGPWGLHYERTQTWWEESKPWHEYLARCQYMLRQGLFVADICYLQPEGAPRLFKPPVKRTGNPPDRPGYNFDGCSPEVVLTRMSVKNGRIVLPDGMSYRVLALPDARTMTPQLLTRIKELVQAGAVVVGPPPEKSPGLENYPACDDDVQQLAGQLWGDCDGKTITEHALGKGRVVWGVEPDKVLAAMDVPPDFTCDGNLQGKLRFTHRHLEDGGDLYFVANSRNYPVAGTCAFRVSGKHPQFLWPQTGLAETAASYWKKDAVTGIPIHLDATESVFILFRPGRGDIDPVVSLQHDGEAIVPRDVVKAEPAGKSRIVIQNAVYWVPGHKSRRNATAAVQALVDDGIPEFTVGRLAASGNPDPWWSKTLTIEYTIDGKPHEVTGKDEDVLDLNQNADVAKAKRTAGMQISPDGNLILEAWQNGRYELKTAGGKVLQETVTGIPPDMTVSGPWDVRFPANAGAPPEMTLDKLVSWSRCDDAGVKYFSGTATYTKTFSISPEQVAPGRALYLDLGQVEVIARVQINGKDLGTLWKAPYRVEITDAVKPGDNVLEVEVTNLWINRMIGDEFLPEDSQRNTNGTLKAWPQWVQESKPSPSGRFTFTTWRQWKKDSPLQDSGLIGPVTLQVAQRSVLH